MGGLRSLRRGGLLLMVSALLLGLLAGGLWLSSDARWRAHLERAALSGALLYPALQGLGPLPPGLALAPLDPAALALAEAGRFERLAPVGRPALVTHIPLPGGPGAPLSLAILSPDLRYPLAGLTARPGQGPAEMLAAVTRLLATYCSDPQVLLRSGDGPWQRLEGAEVWGCAAAPRDLRLLALALAACGLAVLATLVLNSAARFTHFARALGSRSRLGGPETYETGGPEELRAIVAAVNGYLAVERDRLAQRATVLSGVSHDLGTPATRLRLRAALIEDPELRARLEADIDKMTGMIESVLTYTRAELDAEAPRRLSLTSLIDSLVADYQDIGRPVTLRPPERVTVRGGRSLFMSRRGTGALPEESRVVVTARPVALGRALTNLVENALKYGRRATVGLEVSAESALITVEDAGQELSVEEIEALMAPFQRGANSGTIEGHGLGLTIAAAVANLHGGELSFEPGSQGLRARLRISRA
jgi:signal transduction histidine kinase